VRPTIIRMKKQFPALRVPLVQAPMGGGGSTVAMAAAVSNAGGLGSLAGGYLTGAQIACEVKTLRELTDKPFAINLFLDRPPSPPIEIVERANAQLRSFRAALGIAEPGQIPLPSIDRTAQIEAMLEARPSVFSFTFGIPDVDVFARCDALGIVTLGTATTVEEALALERAGVDAICVQGAEAGAHRGTFLRAMEESMIGTLALVPQVVDAVKVPVIAAGGIGDGRGLAAVLALGAIAAQVGTSFLLSDESAIPPAYRSALGSDDVAHTTITRAFSGRAARGIVNAFIEKMRSVDAIAPYPYQNTLTRDIRAAAAQQGRAEFLSLWAGQAATLAKARRSAEIVASFEREARDALERARHSLISPSASTAKTREV
jgi:nitronate monooxygenase